VSLPVTFRWVTVPGGVEQFALKLDATPVANWPPVHWPGVEAAARAVVAAFIPEPENPIEQPVPQTIAAVVLVELVIEAKALELPEPQAAPESITVPVADHWVQWPEVIAPLKMTRLQLMNEVQPVPPLTIGNAPLKALAVTKPPPVGANMQPVPQSMAAELLVPPVSDDQLPVPEPEPQGAPASPIVVEVKNLVQSPGVGEATIRACCM